MNKLLKEAIADAKAVRETALANAKLALEEAFTPRLQSMLSAKLSEEEESHMEEDEMPMDEPTMETPPTEEPEMEMGEMRGDDMEEGMREDEVEEGMREDEVEEGMREDDMEEGMREDDDELSEEDKELEEILRELEEEDDTMDEGQRGDKETDENEDKDETNEVSDSSKIGSGDNKVDVAYGKDQDDPGKGKLKEEDEKDKTDEEKDVDLDEIIEALREEDEKTDEGMREDEVEEGHTAGVDDGGAAKELEEAYKVIRFMKSKLNEVNLLNAKLLFSNKLFRNHSLNESQKMKVIENFDRAQTLREVKLVFATLSESFRLGGGKKKSIKESYASKASRSTKPSKRVLSEGNEVANRFKKLAGLL